MSRANYKEGCHTAPSTNLSPEQQQALLAEYRRVMAVDTLYMSRYNYGCHCAHLRNLRLQMQAAGMYLPQEAA